MRLLLDTHALVWALAEPDKLSSRARSAISNSRSDVYASMASAWELSILQGLARVRHIQLDDAHNFCALDQVGEEVAGVLRLMRRAHDALGMRPSAFRLSLRGDGGKYAGDDLAWAKAERLLREALDGIAYEEAPGEAAFYGPKIDVQIRDSLGRDWTLATIQVDFHQPAQFDLSFAAADGGRDRPVMVHQSLVGSMERLFGHLIEVHGGAFPVWYSPVQIDVLPLGAGQAEAARHFAAAAIEAGLRAEVREDASIGARIRASAERRIPYAGIVGEREVADGLIALRLRDGRQLPPMPQAEAIALIASIASARSADLIPQAGVAQAGFPQAGAEVRARP